MNLAASGNEMFAKFPIQTKTQTVANANQI